MGKTLSARWYASADRLDSLPLLKHVPLEEVLTLGEERTFLYTAPVVNAPGTVERSIEVRRHQLHTLCNEPSLREEYAAFEELLRYEEERSRERVEQIWQHDWLSGPRPEPPRMQPTFGEVRRKYDERRRAIGDPTDLILVYEANARIELRVAGEALFHPQHSDQHQADDAPVKNGTNRFQARPLGAAEVRTLLLAGWSPPGLCLPPLDEEAVATVIRVTGGNFRLLDRLLAQAERIVRINGLLAVTRRSRKPGHRASGMRLQTSPILRVPICFRGKGAGPCVKRRPAPLP